MSVIVDPKLADRPVGKFVKLNALAAPLAKLIAIDLIVQTACKVTFDAVVYVPTIASPVGLVDQPAKSKPSFARVPAPLNVTAVPAVVYVSVARCGEPEFAPFEL